jgi:OmpA-OmpF porin, OOP family
MRTTNKINKTSLCFAAAVVPALILLAPSASAQSRSAIVIAQANSDQAKDKKKNGNVKKLPHGGVKHGPPPGAARHAPPPSGIKRLPPIGVTKHTQPPGGIKHLPSVGAAKHPAPVGVKPSVRTQQIKPVQKFGVTKPDLRKRVNQPKTVTTTTTGKQQIKRVTPVVTAVPPTTPANVRRLSDFRNKRHEVKQGNRTIIQEPGRTIIREGGRLVIHHNETERFRSKAAHVRTERRGKDVATIIQHPNGARVINVTDPSGHLVKRIRRDAGGREVVLIDNTRRRRAAAVGAAIAGAGIAAFILNMAPPRIHIPRDRYIVDADRADSELIYETLMAPPVDDIDRDYSLDEIRYNAALRDRMRRIDIDTITFDSGSWEVRPDQVERLQVIADAMLRAIRQNPDEIFMVEGYTDAVGSDVDNLSLSDRRAEAVAQVLTERFGIPPENLTTQGYGEQFLKIPTQGPDERNRRVTVRRITPLLRGKIARRP